MRCTRFLHLMMSADGFHQSYGGNSNDANSIILLLSIRPPLARVALPRVLEGQIGSSARVLHIPNAVNGIRAFATPAGTACMRSCPSCANRTATVERSPAVDKKRTFDISSSCISVWFVCLVHATSAGEGIFSCAGLDTLPLLSAHPHRDHCCLQAHETAALMANFPPRSLASVVTVRDTLLSYAQSYPVSVILKRRAAVVQQTDRQQP